MSDGPIPFHCGHGIHLGKNSAQSGGRNFHHGGPGRKLSSSASLCPSAKPPRTHSQQTPSLKLSCTGCDPSVVSPVCIFLPTPFFKGARTQGHRQAPEKYAAVLLCRSLILTRAAPAVLPVPNNGRCRILQTHSESFPARHARRLKDSDNL